MSPIDHSLLGHPGDRAPTAGDDARARQGLTILCIVYLLLGIVGLGAYLLTDFGDILDRQDAAHATAFGLLDTAPQHQRDAVALERTAADEAANRAYIRLAGFGGALLVVGWFLGVQRRRLHTYAQVTNGATVMIVLMGIILLASRLALQQALPDVDVALWGLGDLVVMHLVACMVMPWSMREATLPFGVLLLVWAATFLVPGPGQPGLTDRVVGVIMSPLALGPGIMLAGWRTRRRAEQAERRLLDQRVESYGGELSRARIVHDAMFPPPFMGPICFEYEYQPIHEIGGDYVHVHVSGETGAVLLTLLDVAGHGLAAALTVNRLFGELERILAENTAADPAEVITLLNRYIYLTMARHSLYATGTSMMLDPTTGVLEWVNAGHPPALVRRVSGPIFELETTCMLLGAQDPDLYEPDAQRTTLAPGDVVIAYTDGAFEARDERGERFGLDGVRELARFDPPPRSWPRFLAGAVAKHHAGHAEDDVLIAALTLRSLRVPDMSAAGGVQEAVRS